MKIINSGIVRFDTQLPIYNWFYPLQYAYIARESLDRRHATFNALGSRDVRSRALYLHVPFCDTICSFCPFIRGRYRDQEIVEAYTQALIREIELRSQEKALHAVPIEAIFVGGGTPSVLSGNQIRRIGASLSERFDLSFLREFTFELEVKTIDDERIEAMKEIGVTHTRFGVQSFDPTYRRLLALTATVEQVETAAALLQKAFSYVSFDILYGLNGQSTEQVLSDVRHAVALGTPTIDFYPINNLVTQQKLHRSFQAKGWLPISAIERLHMKRAIDTYMRASGFLPHNGHGYVHAPDNILADDPPITDWYRFHYHEYGYGYADHEIIGFGASAISSTRTFTATNTTRREEYIQSLLGGSLWEITLSMHKNAASEARGIIMHLPYYGVLDASRIDWATIHPDTLQALEELIDAGLVQEDSGHYTTSRAARYWYVNMMYYLMPKAEQKMLDDFISTKCQEPGRIIEDAELLQKKPFLYVDGGRL